jgi:hypothetical protein
MMPARMVNDIREDFMADFGIPHVSATYIVSKDGRRVLNVRTDLPLTADAPGYDAAALRDLNSRLETLIDASGEFDCVVLSAAERELCA